MTTSEKLLCLLMLATFTPISEELLFRHFLIRVFPLNRRFWNWMGILVTSGSLLLTVAGAPPTQLYRFSSLEPYAVTENKCDLDSTYVSWLASPHTQNVEVLFFHTAPNILFFQRLIRRPSCHPPH